MSRNSYRWDTSAFWPQPSDLSFWPQFLTTRKISNPITFWSSEIILIPTNSSTALAATKKANDWWWFWTLHTGISIHIVKPVVDLARGHQPIFKVQRRHQQLHYEVWDETTVCLRCSPRSIENVWNACQWPLLRYIHVGVELNTSHD